MASHDDTKPGTPAALRVRARPSGTFEIDPEAVRQLADRLAEAKLHVIQERLAVVESELAMVRAELAGRDRPMVVREERAALPPDPRSDP